MPFPSQTDAMIRERFEFLMHEGHQLVLSINALEIAVNKQLGLGDNRGDSKDIATINESTATEEFHALKTSALSLIELLGGDNNRHLAFITQTVRNFSENSRDAEALVGILMALQRDYQSGVLDSLVMIVEADVAADYLGQADSLLSEGQPGKYDHVPAAVLTGAILEDSLRRLCERQSPPVPTVKSNGEPKMLNALIDDLKKAGLYNELKAKHLRAWADIRNAAAHGEFEKFDRQQVEQMLTGVQNFLADYL